MTYPFYKTLIKEISYKFDWQFNIALLSRDYLDEEGVKGIALKNPMIVKEVAPKPQKVTMNTLRGFGILNNKE